MDKVFLLDYDPRWPDLYEEERAKIAGTLADLVVDIHHIGSTSVPGLAAKPVIDILVGVKHLDLTSTHMAEMTAVGYEYRGDAGISGRLFFRKGIPRTHHVHVVRYGDEIWDNHLLFRDYLQAHPGEARRYAELKRQLASSYKYDRARYTESKSPFITSVLSRARAWARLMLPPE